MFVTVKTRIQIRKKHVFRKHHRLAFFLESLIIFQEKHFSLKVQIQKCGFKARKIYFYIIQLCMFVGHAYKKSKKLKIK
jgi:hypothetical protein